MNTTQLIIQYTLVIYALLSHWNAINDRAPPDDEIESLSSPHTLSSAPEYETETVPSPHPVSLIPEYIRHDIEEDTFVETTEMHPETNHEYNHPPSKHAWHEVISNSSEFAYGILSTIAALIIGQLLKYNLSHDSKTPKLTLQRHQAYSETEQMSISGSQNSTNTPLRSDARIS